MRYRLFAVVVASALIAGCGGGHSNPPLSTAKNPITNAASSTASNTAQSIDVYVNPQDLVVDQTTNEVYKFNLDGRGNPPAGTPTALSAYSNVWVGSTPTCTSTASACTSSQPSAPAPSWTTKGANGIFDVTTNAALANGTSVSDAIADEACKFWNGDALDSFTYQLTVPVVVGSGRTRATDTWTFTYSVTPNGTVSGAHFAWYVVSSSSTGGNATLQLDGYIAGESVVFSTKMTSSCNNTVNSSTGKYCYRVSFSMDTTSTNDSGLCADGTSDDNTRVCDLTANIYADDGNGNPTGDPVLTLSQNSSDPTTLITVGPVNYNSTNGTDANGNPNFSYTVDAGQYYGAGGNPSAASGNLAYLSLGGSSTPFDAGQAENGAVPDGNNDYDDFQGNNNYGIQTAPFSSPQFTLQSGDYIGVLTGTVKSNNIITGTLQGLSFSVTQHVRVHLADADGKCTL